MSGSHPPHHDASEGPVLARRDVRSGIPTTPPDTRSVDRDRGAIASRPDPGGETATLRGPG